MPRLPSETMTAEIEVAARWWAEHLDENSFDNGGRSPTSAMATGLALLGSRGYPAEVVEAFRVALEGRIAESINLHGYCLLSVDYDPNVVLERALEDVGIRSGKTTGLPWKTAMWVKPGKVTVKDGYGAGFRPLYPAPEIGHG